MTDFLTREKQRITYAAAWEKRRIKALFAVLRIERAAALDAIAADRRESFRAIAHTATVGMS